MTWQPPEARISCDNYALMMHLSHTQESDRMHGQLHPKGHNLSVREQSETAAGGWNGGYICRINLCSCS
ncbi:hypothetical protein L6452_02230 [Arctium lappa]|uniref:Uncharacterized protein n=1 Tax=Arctium lappa TaxID=4217 RepID=A0ACB9FIU5_ARCLA|nr:hypothetical protein L6452_02230 [Arctium lappa]